MNDKHFEILLKIQSELSTNTEATKSIQKQQEATNDHLKQLNGKTARNVRDIGRIVLALTIVGTVVFTLLVVNGSELIEVIKIII